MQQQVEQMSKKSYESDSSPTQELLDSTSTSKAKGVGKEATQIKKGERRSPGRPKGSKNRKSIIEAAIQTKLVNELEQDAVEIYQKAAQMAKEGDKTMLKLFLNRILPELKAHGSDDNFKGTSGIQIIVNQGYGGQSEEKDVSGVTINQLETDEDIEDGEYEEG